MDELRKILMAASGMPVANARRIVGALAVKTQDGETQDAREDGAMPALRKALSADMKPLGDALFSAYQAGDGAAMVGALKKISKGMPELAGEANELSLALAKEMAAAFTG